MRYTFSILVLSLSILFLCSPFFINSSVKAHGGIEKKLKNIEVMLYQTPLSPFIGEEVKFSFLLNDITTQKRLPNMPFHLKIIETTTGDASKDKVIYQKDAQSDINGSLSFSYQFTRSNYYDIELRFGDTDSEENTIGFLVQPREKTNENKLLIPLTFAFLMINCILLYLLFRKRKRIRTQRKLTI